MRKYTTPTLEVVKLLVIEDMAAETVSGISGAYDGSVNTTTYKLTTDTVSEANKPDSQNPNP